MKAILNKLFGVEKEATSAQLPLPVTTESIEENQKRALIGWIAARMAHALRIDKDQSSFLIYLPFSVDPIADNTDDPAQYLLYLASCLVEWVKQGEDVYLKIRELHLPDKYHRAFLETYEQIKEDIPLYLPSRTKVEPERPSEDDVIWQVYRDVIFAATQQKFLLIRKSEVDRYREGDSICKARIVERSDIPKARDLAKLRLQESGLPNMVVMSYLLVISEAITNILKHSREGQMTIVQTDSTVNVLVEDIGPGFPLELLPKMTLMAGYSTKKSLGQGFTLMMKMTDQIVLSTVPNEGSTLILIFRREEEVQRIDQSG